MTANETLTKIASLWSYQRNPGRAGPWLLDIAGAWWGVATEGHVMLWVRADRLSEPLPAILTPDSPEFPGLYDLLGKFLYARPKDHALGISVAPIRSLIDFAGSPVWVEECPVCHGKSGSGYECDMCCDIGTCAPEPRRAWVIGRPVDANLLARALPAFQMEPDLPVKIAVVPSPLVEKNGNILYVWCDFFIVALMGMTYPHAMPDYQKKLWEGARRFPQ